MHLVVQAVSGGPNITGVRSKAKYLFCSVRYPEDWTDSYDCVSILTHILQVKESPRNKVVRKVKKLVHSYHSYARAYPKYTITYFCKLYGIST